MTAIAGGTDAVEILSHSELRDKANLKSGVVMTRANPNHWKGGGPHEEENRDHRREAPAGGTESKESLSSCLVRNLCRASPDGDA